MRAWWIALVLGACSHAATPPPSSTSQTTPAREAPRAEARHIVTETTVELLHPIRFLPASSTLDPRSTKILDAIAQALVGNPNIQLVEVQTFAVDALAQFRARIAAERAQIIVDELVARGVQRARLTPVGYMSPPPGNTGEPLLVVLQRTD